MKLIHENLPFLTNVGFVMIAIACIQICAGIALIIIGVIIDGMLK